MNSQNNIRIAITNDTRILRCRLLVKLIEICGATPVLIPQSLKPSSVGISHKEEIKDISYSLLEPALEKHLNHVKELLETCDGLLLPGNKHDVPPGAYGQNTIHPETAKRLSKHPLYVRFETETAMAKYALKANWPILAICGGMQVMNVVLGGSLVQHLPDDERVKQGKVPHRDPTLKKLSQKQQKEWEQTFENHILTDSPENIYPATHGMRVEPDSLLADIYREIQADIALDDIGELSIHHQGCFEENLGKGLRPVAIAPDGVVEAAELTSHDTMCLLTQFHFECNVSGMAKTAIQRLINAAK